MYIACDCLFNVATKFVYSFECSQQQHNDSNSSTTAAATAAAVACGPAMTLKRKAKQNIIIIMNTMPCRGAKTTRGRNREAGREREKEVERKRGGKRGKISTRATVECA